MTKLSFKMPARALALALWPLATRGNHIRGDSLPGRPTSEEAPLQKLQLRRLQGFEPSTGAEGLQWNQAPAVPQATVPPLAPALPGIEPAGIPGMLEHPMLDCWGPCGDKAGYCKWCGMGNSCCRKAAYDDPPECRTASVFMTLHHECVQTLPPSATATAAPPPAATAAPPPATAAPPPATAAPAAATAAPPPPQEASTDFPTPAPTPPPTNPPATGPPTVAPQGDMVPAAQALLSTTMPVANPGQSALPNTPAPASPQSSVNQAQPLPTVPPLATLPPVTLSTTLPSEEVRNEKYYDRRDRFIKAPDGGATWFQDAQTLTKHVVRFRCKACGDPPPCKNYVTVSRKYIENLTVGEDFQCEMLEDSSPHGFHAKPITTTTYTPAPITTPHTSTTTTTTTTGPPAGFFGSFSWLGVLALVLLVCCCAAAAVGAFMMYGQNGRKKGKKGGRRARAAAKNDDDASSNGANEDDQVPLVFGEEDNYRNNSFASQQPGPPLSQQAQMAAMAPTYAAMTPQMAQAQYNAQMAQQAQLPTQTQVQPMPQAQLPTQTQLPQMPPPQGPQAAMATQAWLTAQTMQPGLQQSPSYPPQGMNTYAGLPTQTSLVPQQQQQEMELVTVTPNGLAVTPLAPGQQLPAGVPVLNSQPNLNM